MPLRDCDRSIIESALASPRASFGGVEFYRDLPSKAAVLLYSLAKSQACIDGNKRLALILVYAFLDLNGATLGAASNDVANRILEVAESDPSDRETRISELAAWLGNVVREDAR